MLFSLLFYFIDSGYYLIILLITIIGNYYIGLILYSSENKYKNIILIFALIFNLIPLLFFKYWMFFLQSLNDIYAITNSNIHFQIPEILLLSGISFFTFHSISYQLDIKSKKIEPSRSLIDFGMYMSCFPQLIAGPIVRYSEISNEISKRHSSLESIYRGIYIFSLGLASKVVLADSAGAIADKIFSKDPATLSFDLAWIGALCYTFQIYFDFAGYSNMAIGLAKMMGFDFPENFNQPYRSKNITEFWQRWHMTLSRWFKDYVYIPLGGNRKGQSRTLFNLLVVFFLCGLWHGASYTFIVWGLYHGFLLIIDKLSDRYNAFKINKFFSQAGTFFLIVIGWVFFRSPHLEFSITYIERMFSFDSNWPTFDSIYFILIGPDKFFFILLCIFFSFYSLEKSSLNPNSEKKVGYFKIFISFFLIFLSTTLISSNGFNPFIYFKF